VYKVVQLTPIMYINAQNHVMNVPIHFIYITVNVSTHALLNTGMIRKRKKYVDLVQVHVLLVNLLQNVKLARMVIPLMENVMKKSVLILIGKMMWIKNVQLVILSVKHVTVLMPMIVILVMYLDSYKIINVSLIVMMVIMKK